MTPALSLDPGLIERARGGELKALDRLLVVCRPNLERYARRHCQSDDVDEAIQDALWILCRKIAGLRDVAALAGWLFQVVRRACVALSRRRQAHAPLEAARNTRDATASDPELRAMVVAAISELPPRYREVLLLKDVHGFSAQEVALAIGVAEEAAKSRLHRARALMRAALADGGQQ